MRILLLCFCFCNLVNFAQNDNSFSSRSKFSLGLTVGYKTDAGTSAIQIGYLIEKRVDINIHYGANKYEGGGLGGGLKCMILKDKKFVPYIGVTYDKFSSHNTGFEVLTDSVYSGYSRKKSDIILAHAGLLYQESALSLFVSVNYKYPVKMNELVLEYGPHNHSTEATAKQVYSPGLGCTVGIIFHFWGRYGIP